MAAPPGAPTLTAQSGNKFIDLSWSESNNGGSAITGWEYRWSDDDGENWDPSEGWHSLALATTELQLSGTNGTELTVELRAVNARGSGPATQVKATPTPDNSAPTFDDGENATRAVPENSTVDSNGDPVTVGTAITATDQDEGDVLTYALVDDEDSEDDEAFTINTESGQLSVAADANLNYESQDSYSLTVSVKDNRDDANNVDDAVDATIAVTVNIQDEIEPPATPAIPAVSNRSAHHLTISWSPPDNAGPEISSYNFDWRLPGASEFTTETPDGDAKNITLLGLTHSTTYEFRLQAVNAEGASGWSDTGTGTTLADVPEAPSTLSAAINATDIDLSWTAGADRGAAIDLWQYRYSTDDGENWEDWTNIANSDATTAAHSVSNLSFGFVYSFEVRARNSTGFSASSPIASVVFGNRPAVFDDGAAVIRSVEENMAAGTKVGEPVVAQDPDGDTLTYSLSGTDAGSFDIDSNTGQITVGGSTVLDYETTASYSMTVEVTDGKDETGASQTASTTDGTISVTVNVTDVKPPGAPTGLTLKSPSPTKLTVRWSAPDEGAPPTHYVVRYQEDGCTGLTCWSDGSTVKGTYTTLTGLTTATDYEVSVEAHNVEGSDADSAVARTRDLTKVTSVSLTSDAGDDSVYAIGDEVQATVMFDGRVFVSANANPTLVLAIGDEERTASYKSGGGTDSLLFSYVIVDGDSDSDGIGIAENALGIKETDLWDISGTAPASKHDAVTEQMDHQVDGIRPMITKLEITSKPTHNNTYARNESIIVKVDFDDKVYITGTPSLMLRVGDTIRAAPLLCHQRLIFPTSTD
ncbi:MAG: hypothetical protein F4082_04830 [Gammaproteobacteria bacterium]|nr:hypothetical protein [Gammaproteobacteria bacterium]